MRIRISQAILYSLLGYLFGLIFWSAVAFGQEPVKTVAPDTVKTEIVLAEQRIPLDTLEVLKLESRVKISHLAEELFMLKQARTKYQTRLDSLSAKIERSKGQ